MTGLSIPRFTGRALCAETDPDVFFPDERQSDATAKNICQPCPARQECLDWALTYREPHGVWGGLSPGERARLRPGRPVPASLSRRVPPRKKPINHGTAGGYAAHHRRHEPMCQPCRDAHQAAKPRRRRAAS